MNRLFLTILALFAGLAAQVSTAQARVCTGAETEIGSVQGLRSNVGTRAHAASRFEAPAARQDHRSRTSERIAHSSLPVLYPPIYLGADRAIE